MKSNSRSIALGVKVFNRTRKLERLLKSVANTHIGKVYVADDGHTEERDHVYEQSYPFELELLDLEFDAGLGYGRERIVETFTEDFLLIVDSDHEVPNNVDLLADQLEARPDIGGISGLLLEHSRVKGLCHDLYEESNILIRDIASEKPVEDIADAPFIPFDFIPNVAMFRRECLKERSWDPSYIIGREHLDFYVGHKKHTNWQFGVNPRVLFSHYPGGGTKYMSNRTNSRKIIRSKEYFLEKWEYEQIIAKRFWIEGSTLDKPFGNLPIPNLPLRFQASVMNVRDLIWDLKSWGMPKFKSMGQDDE